LRQPETLNRSFHLLFESSPDAFLLIDSTGTIAAANPPTELLLGHAPRELAGSPAAPILPSLDLAARHLEVDARHRDGSIVPVEVSLTSFTSEGERWVLARLSRRTPRGSEATAAILKAEFLSVLMHELRTPLQTMLGWAQHLRAGPRDPATLDQGLATIERNVRWQAEVLEDLIEMSQLVSGELRLHLRPTSVREVIESSIDRNAAMASSKRIRFAWAPGEVGDEITADAIRLGQVIARLLSNAIRFSSEGGVVAIRLHQLGASLRITVADDGQGEDPVSFHASAWFRRAAPGTVADFARFGVGLSNVQRVVEMHGGEVGAESTGPGRETRFFVTLPLLAR
jgi:PAS domain S-box-containing protein